MVYLLLSGVFCSAVTGIEVIKCADVESEWNQGMMSRCNVTHRPNSSTYLAAIECYERNGTDLPWENIGKYTASGHTPHEKHKGKLYEWVVCVTFC